MTKREQVKDSWRSVWTLIKLQTKAGIKLPRANTPVRTALKWAVYFLIGIVLLGVLITVYTMLAGQFVRQPGSPLDLRREFLIFTLVGFQILQTIFLIPMLIKVLDLTNDRDLLLKLPVSSTQIFISKISHLSF